MPRSPQLLALSGGALLQVGVVQPDLATLSLCQSITIGKDAIQLASLGHGGELCSSPDPFILVFDPAPCHGCLARDIPTPVSFPSPAAAIAVTSTVAPAAGPGSLPDIVTL